VWGKQPSFRIWERMPNHSPMKTRKNQREKKNKRMGKKKGEGRVNYCGRRRHGRRKKEENIQERKVVKQPNNCALSGVGHRSLNLTLTRRRGKGGSKSEYYQRNRPRRDQQNASLICKHQKRRSGWHSDTWGGKNGGGDGDSGCILVKEK